MKSGLRSSEKEMKCKDCAYLKPMKPDPDLMVCKNKNSQWYVVDPEKDKCKYFEAVNA